MGRPKDKQDRLLQRATEDLEKGLSRRDVDLAVASLLKLPAGERGPFLLRVRTLLRAELARCHQGGDFARLGLLSSRVSAEPRLVLEAGDAAGPSGPGMSPDDRAAAWSLLWGAARTKDFYRALGFFAQLEGDLLKQAPTLHAWLNAWLLSQGKLSPDEAAALPPLPRPQAAPSALDLRVNNELAKRRAPRPAPPASAEGVRDAVLAVAASEPIAGLRECIVAWLREVPPALAAPIAHLSAQLAVREALRRAVATPPLSPAPALLFLAELAALAPKDQPRDPTEAKTGADGKDLAAEVFLGFRLASSAIGQRDLVSADEVKAFSAITLAAVRYDEHRQAVIDRVLHLEADQAGRRPMLGLLEQLVRLSPGVPLWIKAVTLWQQVVEDEDDGGPIFAAPDWLTASLAALLRAPDELLSWLRHADGKSRMSVLHAIGDDLPWRLGAELVTLAWDGADEELRRDLARLVMIIMKRQDPADLERLGPAMGAGRASYNDLLDLLDELGMPVPDDIDDYLGGESPNQRLPKDLQSMYVSMRLMANGKPMASPEKQAFFVGFRDRVLPYHIDFLRLILLEEGSLAERRAAVDRFLSDKPGIAARLDVLRMAYLIMQMDLYSELLGRIPREFAGDALALSRGLRIVRDEEAPHDIALALAQALLAADASFAGPRTAEYNEMIVAALRLVPRPRPAVKSRPQKKLPRMTAAPDPPAAKPAAKKEPAAKKKSAAKKEAAADEEPAAATTRSRKPAAKKEAAAKARKPAIEKEPGEALPRRGTPSRPSVEQLDLPENLK